MGPRNRRVSQNASEKQFAAVLAKLDVLSWPRMFRARFLPAANRRAVGEVRLQVVSLIVMEPGSAWPGHVRDSENVVTVGHYDDEGLLPRTRYRIDLIQRRGQRVQTAVLACNASVDVSSTACRAGVALALLDAVAVARSGRLVLTAAVRASLGLRCELQSLAGALRLARGDTSVSVRFVRTTDGLAISARRRSGRKTSTAPRRAG